MKKTFRKIVPFLLMAVLGGVVGFFGASTITKIFPKEERSFLHFLVLILVLYVCMMLQIMVHEAGHLVFGLLSGYKFCSYRIFNLCLIKRDGKIVLKKYSLAGTGGQCLMEPPDMVADKIPVFWYNMGGSLLNLIASFIGIIFVLLVPFIWIKIFFMIFAIVGIVFALMNGIPITNAQIDNDGKNAISLGKNKKALKGFWIMMKINALSTEGIEITCMPSDWFFMPTDEDLDNPMVASCGIFYGNRLMYEHDFAGAKEVYQHLLDKAVNMPGIYRVLAGLDLMYIEIIGENNNDTVEQYFTKEAKAVMKSMKNNPGILRCKYVYEKSLGNDEKAKKIRHRFEKTEHNYLYPGEVKAERILMELYDKKHYREL